MTDPERLAEVEQLHRDHHLTPTWFDTDALMEEYDRRGAVVDAARERIVELEAGREIEQTMPRNAAARIVELESDRHPNWRRIARQQRDNYDEIAAENQQAAEFLRWLVSMDDPEVRRSVRWSEVVDRARKLLDVLDDD